MSELLGKPEGKFNPENSSFLGESETPKKSPEAPASKGEKTSSEEPEVRGAKLDKRIGELRDLLKETADIRKARKSAKSQPSTKKDLGEGEEEGLPVTLKQVKDLIAPIYSEVVDTKEMTKAFGDYPDLAKDGKFVNTVAKYGKKHSTVPFKDIIELQISKQGKAGVSSEEGSATSIGGDSSSASRKETSPKDTTTEDLEKEIDSASREDIEEVMKKGV